MSKLGKQDTLSAADFQTIWKKQMKEKFLTVWKVKAGDVIKFDTWCLHSIDWGDGTVEQVQGGDDYKELKHTYVKNGEYTVAMSSGITNFRLNEESAKKLIEIKQWGIAQWECMSLMFDGAENMVCTATDTPHMSKVENMFGMFRHCQKFNSPIEHWDTRCVKYMNNMLFGALMFNQPLAKMDLRAIKQVGGMLECTPALDQDLLDFILEVDTDGMFGYKKSLAQYNEEHGEIYEATELQQELMNVLKG